ncbi:uncharacterized protein [Dysidea avara]|uniref:uncharacterized protein isoform X2 n=1 Tax=Dysidea avara TaxID=196820 RepID=UPI00331DCB27
MKTNVNRSANACRSKVTRWLSKRYKTPKEAEAFYKKDDQLPRVPVLSSTADQMKTSSAQTNQVDGCLIMEMLNQLPEESRLPLLSELFSLCVSMLFKLSVPDDFLCLAASAMVQLSSGGHTNVLYNLAKGMGTLRPDKSEPRFPINKMLMGLVEYTALFFAFDNLQQISCPLDYRQWLLTMYCNFGEKWVKLHRGPMWCVASSVEDPCSSTAQNQNTMKALVNIPAISERSIRSTISSCTTTLDSQVQGNVLDEAAKQNPDAWWWVKADGCDIIKGLKESSRLEWSGDVDLGDGFLQDKYSNYKERLKAAEKVGLCDENVVQDLSGTLNAISKDLEFLQAELIKFNNDYSEKLQGGMQREKDLIVLAWKVKELTELNENGRELHRSAGCLLRKIEGHDVELEDNVPSQLNKLRQKLVNFIKGVTRHQRTPATHVLVFMISTEDQRRRPYALPVQCIPYKGLTDAKIRELANKLIVEMSKRKMNVAGFTTDGEWNSLQTKGNTRPISIFQIRADARAKFARTGITKMINMITIKGETKIWYSEGATTDDVIERLRLRTVPSGYAIHSWTEGKTETRVEKLR